MAGTLGKVRKILVAQHGEAESRRCIRTYPPRALKGKWSSLTRATKWILNAGRNLTTSVHLAFDWKPSDAAADPDQAEDEGDGDESRVTLGRWRRETCAALASDDSWAAAACYASRWAFHFILLPLYVTSRTKFDRRNAIA